MAATTTNEQEVLTWLQQALASRNLSDVSVEILGNSEKGDGFMGDIVFVHATGTKDNTRQELDLVLKCSKKSDALRESMPISDVFLNEIYFYETLLPTLQQFQKSCNAKEIFNSVPEYLGHFTNGSTEILVLRNLKKSGYELCPRQKPLTLAHLLMVAQRYGQYHSISAAIQTLKPELFQQLRDKLVNIMKKLSKSFNMVDLMENSIKDPQEVLTEYYGKELVDKFMLLIDQINYIINEMKEEDCFKIVSHGDSWNNNFMWKHNKVNKTKPEEVAIIDWQLTSIVSPIFDLSHFCFACIAPEDTKNIALFLDTYYGAFSKSLREMGCDPDQVYSKAVFLNDWKKYCRYGIAMSVLLTKMAFCEGEDVPDVVASAEKGEALNETFKFKISDNEGYSRRLGPIIEYVVKNKLIE